MIRLLAILMLTALLSSPLKANFLLNGSFEIGNFTPNSDQTMVLSAGALEISGWQVINNEVAWIKNGNPFGLSAQNGEFFLDLTSYNTSGRGGIQQTFQTSSGYTYKVQFALGSSVNWTETSGVLVEAAGQTATFELTATDENSWELFEWSFVSTAPQTTLSFKGSNGLMYIGLDNVRVTMSAVPEPSGISASALALLGLTQLRSRRTRRCIG